MAGVITSLIILGIGVFIWLANAGYIAWNWGRDWPWILIVIGFLGLVSALGRWIRSMVRRGRSRSAGRRVSVERMRVLRDLEEGKIGADEAADRIRGD